MSLISFINQTDTKNSLLGLRLTRARLMVTAFGFITIAGSLFVAQANAATPFEGYVSNTSGTRNLVRVDSAGRVNVTPTKGTDGRYTISLNSSSLNSFMASHSVSVSCNVSSGSSNGNGSSSSGGGGDGDSRSSLSHGVNNGVPFTSYTDSNGNTTYQEGWNNCGTCGNGPTTSTYGEITNRGGSSSSSSGGGSDTSNDGVASNALCTYYTREKKWLSKKMYHANLAYGYKNHKQKTINGYHLWAIPLVKYLRRHPGSFIEKAIFKVIVEGWVYECAHREGVREKGDIRGKIVFLTMVPICALLGNFAEKRDCDKELWSEKAMSKAA